MATTGLSAGEIRVPGRVVDGGRLGFLISKAKRRGDQDRAFRGDFSAFGLIGLVGDRRGAFQGADFRCNVGEEGGAGGVRWGREAEER